MTTYPQISPANRPNGQFQKGQSGNPGGRPKGSLDIVAKARSQGENAIEALTCIMNDEKAPPAARVSAANSILDRGFGKPQQTMITQNQRDPNQKSAKELTDDELLDIIRAAGIDMNHSTTTPQ